jgi:hypothetical protein
MTRAVKTGAGISMGIDHQSYAHAVDSVPAATRESLAEDLDT